MKRRKPTEIIRAAPQCYDGLLTGISALLDAARRAAARSVNSILTTTYWEIGRRIVEHEQDGQARAGYGEELLNRLSADLTAHHGRGFSARNLRQMRTFYLSWEIWQTPSAKFEARVICPTASGKSDFEKTQTPSAKSAIVIAPTRTPIEASQALNDVFPLSWSHYVRLMAVEKPQARAFYEAEAIQGGWSVRQIDRQISTQFFERTTRSKRQTVMLARGRQRRTEDIVTPDEEVHDPYLLEFLNLKDEYSERDLEDALVRHLEWFLLELGAGFTFVARQKRIRIGGTWYRIDLLLYHRGLRCLIVVDLKVGSFTHADAGQMNLYLNYTKEHLMLPDEGDPVGIIMCSDKDDAVVKYSLGGINARVFASKYMTNLPDEETLRREIMTTRRAIRARLRKE